MEESERLAAKCSDTRQILALPHVLNETTILLNICTNRDQSCMSKGCNYENSLYMISRRFPDDQRASRLKHIPRQTSVGRLATSYLSIIVIARAETRQTQQHTKLQVELQQGALYSTTASEYLRILRLAALNPILHNDVHVWHLHQRREIQQRVALPDYLASVLINIFP